MCATFVLWPRLSEIKKKKKIDQVLVIAAKFSF